MSIPITPFPSINQICFMGDVQETPWNKFGRQTEYFPRGGAALASVLRKLQKELKRNRIIVYIPGYFCNQSLDWLRRETCEIIFYPIDIDFTPDWEGVESLAKAGIVPDLFVLVHYFGFCNDLENAVGFCEKYGAKLLEDAAHVLLPTEQIGKRGWAALFSPHKLLPLPPLGIITHNMYNKNDKWDFATETFCEFEDLLWLAKRSMQSMLTKFRINYKGSLSLPDFDYNGGVYINDVSVNGNDMVSTIAIKWLYGLLKNIDNIASIRQKNYKLLEDLFSKFSNVQPAFSCKSNNAVPYLFAFRSKQNVIKEIFNKLRSRMIPVQTWPDIPPEVVSNFQFHQKTLELRNTILTLPIHHDLQEKQVMYMRNVLDELLTSINSRSKVSMSVDSETSKSFNETTKRQTSFFKLEEHKHACRLKPIDHKQWNRYLKHCNRTNLMQSWEYGEAKKSLLFWCPKRFALVDKSGNCFGIVQVLTVSLPFLGGVSRINRGPLLFENVWKNEPLFPIIEKSVQALSNAAKENHWHLMRISPELPASLMTSELLEKYKFKKRPEAAWGSALVSLQRSVDDIRASLHGKWRNLLKKAEKSGLEFEKGDLEKDLNYLLKEYSLLKQKKIFSGIPEKLFKKMALQKGERWNLSVLYACKDGRRVGGLLFAGHGDTCTYLVGWTPVEGRALQTSYFLIWQAIILFKSLGYHWLDVGGLNELTPKGIAHFKNGLKGERYSLTGEWSL